MAAGITGDLDLQELAIKGEGLVSNVGATAAGGV